MDNLCQVDPDVLMAAQDMNPPTCEAVSLVEDQLQVVDVNRPDIGANPYRKVTNNIGAEVRRSVNYCLPK